MHHTPIGTAVGGAERDHPIFAHRHYELLAEYLGEMAAGSEGVEYKALHKVIDKLCICFSRDHPRGFSRSRFVTAIQHWEEMRRKK